MVLANQNVAKAWKPANKSTKKLPGKYYLSEEFFRNCAKKVGLI
jgi:hypothetical protein